jgi:hypothetical protein
MGVSYLQIENFHLCIQKTLCIDIIYCHLDVVNFTMYYIEFSKKIGVKLNPQNWT